jgi:superfamily II DNA or RNA helicase
LITAADEAALRELVGSTTLARAKAYARRGAVRSSVWAAGGSRVIGEVQGAAPEPYQVSVTVTRSPSAGLSALHGTCTCPVGVNCKHTVALLLAGSATSTPLEPASPSVGRSLTLFDSSPPPARGSGGDGGLAPMSRSGRRTSRAGGWEVPLRDLLLGDQAAAGEVRAPEIGLQFELVLDRPRAGRGPRKAGPGIRVRPVVLGRSGTWTRMGISWANLDSHDYGQLRSGDVDALGLAKELLALSEVASTRRYYSSSYEPEVWLESINSPRLWDLLRPAGDLRVPLISAGRNALPAKLPASPAVATLDVTRSRSGLRLVPQVDVDDQPVPLASSVLLGSPAHGLAWWEDAPASASESPRLHLTSFAEPVDDALWAFLSRGAVNVPARDEERFLLEFCPTLCRRVTLRSSDSSVQLPEVAPATLVLSVGHVGGHRVTLEWARGRAGTSWREDLRESGGHPRDRADTDAVVAAVLSALGPQPELFELTPWGERLIPSSCLEGMTAVRFVSELLPALGKIPGVEIEQVGTVLDYREAAEAPVVSLGGSESGEGDWFDLLVEVTVGGEDVPFQQLFVALAEGQSHLILPSGTYFSLDRDELRQLAAIIAEARALHDAPDGNVRLSRFQASLWEDLCRLGVVTAQAGAWEAAVRALSGATERVEHPTPSGLHAILRPYQQVGFNWLVFLYQHRLGGVLADDMGLGKTLQALALMCHTKEQGLTTAPYLVVAPTSVVQNWAAECRRFSPALSVVTVSETERRRGVPLADMAATADVVITSYALFRIEYDEYEAVEWAGLFVDEAQFAKNRNTKTYQQIKMLPVVFKVAITGTPIENSLMDLWSLLSIAAPGLFARPDRFDEHYRTPIERHSDADRLDQLRRRIRPLMLRRTKAEVTADLPDKQEQVLQLDLNPRHKKLYQTYLARERQKVLGLLGDMSKNRFEIFRSLTLLRQASLDMSLVDPKHAKVPSTKLDVLMEILDDIVADGHRVLVFSQFTRFLGAARHRIEAAGIDHCYLDGRTRRRAEVISDFRTGKAPVFLISLKAGGFGLNLTEADYCVILDPWWNPATEAQAVDRIHRIGQTRKVMVYRLVANDTIEEKVMALKSKKAKLFANVIDGGGFESGALTAADIRSLVS